MGSFAKANTIFALSLFKNITEEDKTGNVFYSPLSISSALAMVYLGARGNTATQMENVLNFNLIEKPMESEPSTCQLMQQVQKPMLPDCVLKSQMLKDTDKVHKAFRDLFSELNLQGVPYSLRLANRVYGDNSLEFEKQYLQDTEEFYQAKLETVDFKSNAEGARVEINDWVEKQTEEKIKNLLPEGAVSSMTALVLVNALYFKGDWKEKFLKEDTREVQFKLNMNVSKSVPMMHQTSRFRLARIPEVDAQILELPYGGDHLSMIVMLPNEMTDNGTGLDMLERNFTIENVIAWTSPDRMELMEVQVGLPKFQLSEMYDLRDILVNMGMADAFDHEKSDLSGMSPSGGLALSKVVHKSYVGVDEKGTEAAAATGVVITLTSHVLPEARFIADHPFLFFIRHNPSKSILFYGRYSSP